MLQQSEYQQQKEQVDIVGIVQQLQEYPIYNTVSLLLDALFIGYKIGKSENDIVKINNTMEMIKEYNYQLQSQTLTLEDKANLYHVAINNTFKQVEQQVNKSIMRSVIIQCDCKICYDKMSLRRLFPLSNCTHIFHKQCLTEYVSNLNQLPIKCPQQECQAEIDFSDLKELMNKTQLDKLEEYSYNNYLIQNAQNLFHCPTIGCNVVVEYQGDQFKCPICRQEYCLKCKKKLHKGACNDQEFDQLAKQKKLKQCKNCKFWVEKNEGCDHMTCRCGHQFCYKCGGDYPNCRCKELISFENFQQRIRDIFNL